MIFEFFHRENLMSLHINEIKNKKNIKLVLTLIKKSCMCFLYTFVSTFTPCFQNLE